MSEMLRQIFLGMGAIILAPANSLPRPRFRITLPPNNSTQAIAHDFSHVATYLTRSIEKKEQEKQLEFKLTALK